MGSVANTFLSASMASKDQTSRNSQPAVSNDFSRRYLLKSIGTAGIAALVPEVAATESSPPSYAITSTQDALGTNFLGNSDNTSGVQNGDTHWTGDVVTTVWQLKTPEWIREQESFVPYCAYNCRGTEAR